MVINLKAAEENSVNTTLLLPCIIKPPTFEPGHESKKRTKCESNLRYPRQKYEIINRRKAANNKTELRISSVLKILEQKSKKSYSPLSFI